MKTKLLLKEEDELVADTQPEEFKEEEVIDFNVSSFATDLIKNKWEQVDNMNGMLMSLPNLDPETTEILKNIISDEYVHIGQLEKVIQSVNPEAAALDVGANEEIIK